MIDRLLGIKDAWNVSNWFEHNFHEESRYYQRNAKILSQITGVHQEMSPGVRIRVDYLSKVPQPIYEYIYRTHGANIS
jgi:hypothetical protein